MITSGSSIGRLRVPAAWETRAAGAVRAMDLHPRSLPDSALLVVRSLQTPVPRDMGYSGVAGMRRWQSLVHGSLSDLARQAVRPAHGPVPPSAGAVLFIDRAELLACLARDWLLGEAGRCWWWEALRGSLDVRQFLQRELLDAPEYLPDVLHRLAAGGAGLVIKLVSSLPQSLALQLVRSVLVVHGLSALAEVIDVGVVPVPVARHTPLIREAQADSSSIPPAPASPSAPAPRGPPGPHARSIDTEAPWIAHVPEARRADLPRATEALLWVPLMITRAPAEARATRFHHAVAAHYATEPAGDQPPTPHRHAPDARAASPALAQPPLPPSRAFGEPARHAPPGILEPVDTPPAPPRRVDRSPPPQAPIAEAPARGSDESQAFSPAVPAIPVVPSAASVPDPSLSIQTSLAGSLFLINLSIALGFYSDFTRPREPGLPLPIWDFLALTTPLLLPEAPPDDPLWELLAHLSGRLPDDPPGAGFTPPTGEPLDTWLDHTVSRLSTALHAMLNADDRPARTLIARPASVRVTPTHVDAHFSLSDHPLSIRIAGLDRNPGWVPAAGRFIAFHFDEPHA